MPEPTTDPTLRVFVVEDEWPARNYLVELLHASRLATVAGAVADAESALQALVTPPGGEGIAVDVVFADVHLVGSPRDDAGLELVRGLSGRPGAPSFVLATAYKEHALEAFELGVVDYLLKPFTEERVEQCLRRVLARKPARPPPSGPTKIVARKKKGLVFLRPEEVWAFEAADRLTFVHTRRGKFDLDLSLAAIEAAFGGGGRALLRAHRNWLVNPEHVRELVRDSGDELVVGGDEGEGVQVPVARERAQLVRDALLADATGLRRA
jgi:DNA-binding LytR/AlgR family response regulator